MIGEVVSRQGQGEEPFPWVTKKRWRPWALKGYQAWQRAVRKARRAARIAWLATGQSVLLVGNWANLNDELALLYDRQPHVKYLAGLEARKTGHRELLRFPDGFFYRRPALAPGYWGWPCRVRFEHQGCHATHQGPVVLSGPMRAALRQSRAGHFRCLYQELRNIRQKIGQPHYRTVDSVRKRAQTCCRRSPVGKLMTI